MAVTNEGIEKEKETLIQRLRSIRLEIKILFLIVVCLTLGFGTYVIYSLNSESKLPTNPPRPAVVPVFLGCVRYKEWIESLDGPLDLFRKV